MRGYGRTNRIDLEGRVAVVTGAANGLGLATAERIIASGDQAVLWDVDDSAIESALAKLDDNAHGRVVELTNETSVEAATIEAEGIPDKIDVLVSNAGSRVETARLGSSAWTSVRCTFEVNRVASYLTSRAVVPRMLAKGGVRIVKVASIGGKEGNPNASHHSASKAGLIGLTKSLGKKPAGSGILVNAIALATARASIFDHVCMAPLCGD